MEQGKKAIFQLKLNMRYHLEENQRSIHKPSLDDNIHVITIAISFPFLFFFFSNILVLLKQ